MTEKTEEKIEAAEEQEEYICDDPVILDAFSDLKTAILAKRTDIVRQILSAAQSLREEDEYDSDGEERSKKELVDKYDSEEYLDLLSLLLNHRDTDSGTLLHYATRIDSADIARTLLSAGANCTIVNKAKLNPYNYCASESMKHAYVGELMQAVSQSRTFRVEQLLSAGIDVNSSDGAASGNTVLHWAVSFADLPTVKLIIERGGDVNGMNADGVVPLHDGIQRGDKDIVEELLKNGADTNTKPVKGNLEGKSPIYLAIKDPELKTLLEQYAEQDTVNTEGEVTEDVHTEEVSEQSTVITEVKHKSRNSMSTSSTHLLNQPSVLPKMVTVDPTLKYLCPPPQRMKQFEGLFFVPPSELTVEIVSSRGHVNDIKDVGNLFTKMFQSIGITLSYIYNGNSTSNYIKETHLQCIISENTFRHKEEYKIQVNTHKVVILSSCTVSMFRGISTFVQCLRLFRGKAVPLLQISDWPSHPHRSVILDFQCNDIPHLDIFCETVDILALFKINQIQLNIQNIGEQKNTGCFNLREFFTLQAYCQKRFILVVPYIVIDEHSNLISHGNNGIFQLNIEKLNNYIDLFPSSNFLHVDLRHASSSKLIQQLHQYCIARNYHLQLTVNEIDMHLDHLTSLLNSFSFTVNLSQADRLEERIEMVDNLGLQCIVCYENNNLNRLFPNIMNAMSSVHEISYKLNNYNVAGLSTKLSSSSKKLCSWSSFLPTIVMTSFMGWNAPKELDETYIKNIINYQIYEDDNDLIGNYFVSMGNSLPLTTADRSLFDDMLAYCSIDASSLTTENLQEICKTIKVLKLDIQKMKLGSSLNNFFVEESIILLNVLFFLSSNCHVWHQSDRLLQRDCFLVSIPVCHYARALACASGKQVRAMLYLWRICYGVLNLQTKDKTQNLDDLSQLNKSDHSNRLMTLINEYEQYCSKYYKHSSSGYVSVELLKNLLRKILPKNAPSSGLLSMFTA